MIPSAKLVRRKGQTKRILGSTFRVTDESTCGTLVVLIEERDAAPQHAHIWDLPATLWDAVQEPGPLSPNEKRGH